MNIRKPKRAANQAKRHSILTQPAPVRGLLVSFEGVSGCGKSFLLSLLCEQLHEVLFTIIPEIEDRETGGFDQEILALLRRSHDRFFRSGYPRADSLVLLALLAHDAQRFSEPAMASGQVVLTNRGLDTVAVYQTLLLHPGAEENVLVAEAHQLYTWACHWFRPPDLTFLLLDDFTTLAHRAQERAAAVYQPEELALLHQASLLYPCYAQAYPDRIQCLDRRVLDNEAIITQMKNTILARYRERDP